MIPKKQVMKNKLIFCLLVIPSFLFAQRIDTLKIRMYKSDTAKTHYRVSCYIAKDTVGGIIYRLIDNGESDTVMVKTRRRKLRFKGDY